ncbi:type VII secretion protein EccE [Nocardia sp. CDC160]|uniref:type VII secretion protein EccE n=1 Tax=Nocardia sp. CDC160 TaxID=3112166 RepID=UPI002DB94834|nr:type VII secretion protein EccE [Nocardia sp. CDC160]MEC3920221.1 type VII secretion protein EccE [Nocardia sp. CDC160]
MVIGGGPVLAGMSTRVPWWVCAASLAAVLASVTVRVNDRTAVGWLYGWAQYRFRRSARSRALLEPADIQDVEVAAGTCGIRTAGTTLVAMVQLAPDLDLPTVIAETTIYTEDTVAVAALMPMLDQYGIDIDIDIVTTGQRVRSTGSYSMLYDQLVGSHPVVGNRLTWLVLRLDQERNLAALTQRGPCAVVAPKALATAAHRIAVRLRERGIAAQALPSAAMHEAIRLLHTGVELAELRERWGRLQASPGRDATSFLVDWGRLDAATLDDCWAWNRGHTTLVLGLTESQQGPRALVRFVGPPVTAALPDYLRRLPGHQAVALRASLPAETSWSAVPLIESGTDFAPDELLADLTIPIGPNGQILGSISGQPRHTLALALFDPAQYQPRRRSVDVQAKLPVAQQIVLRAMAVGADVEVHSARPQRWRQLIDAVGDERSLRLAVEEGVHAADSEVGQRQATIVVFDQIPPRASAAPTTVTINEPGGGRPPRRTADLQIRQVSETAVEVSIPMRTLRVDLIEPRGETRYVDELGDPTTARTEAGHPESVTNHPGR